MTKLQAVGVVSCVCLLEGSGGMVAGETLRMEVAPTIARAPAVVTVRVTVEVAPDDQVLEVAAESPNFYRSSQIQLDGTGSTMLETFEFRNLPTGIYQITGVLAGPQGPRVKASRLLKVAPGVGSPR